MEWLSFNCRGLARSAKKLALRRLIVFKRFDVIFLKETLGISDQIVSLLEAMILGWTFHALDVRG